MRRLLAVLAVLTVLVGPLLMATPADSATSPWRGVATFDKNWDNQFDSRLTWRLYHRESGSWKVVESHSWRAGSGLPGGGGKDSCATSRGWLPNGTYGMRQYAEYPGNLIKGRVFRIDDKACPSGQLRRDLFVHTEQGPGSHQCPDRRGDQACRWEWPRINDYKSLGCIKMSPGDLAQLTAMFHRHFAAGVRYPADRVSLHVVS